MIDLSIVDVVDGSSKVSELRNAIGKEFSDNHSSTGRSVLLSVEANGNVCVTQEVEAYGRKPKAGTKRVPSWLTWNAMFF